MTVREAIKELSTRFENVSVSVNAAFYRKHGGEPWPQVEISAWNDADEIQRHCGRTIQGVVEMFTKKDEQEVHLESAVKEIEAITR